MVLRQPTGLLELEWSDKHCHSPATLKDQEMLQYLNTTKKRVPQIKIPINPNYDAPLLYKHDH